MSVSYFDGFVFDFDFVFATKKKVFLKSITKRKKCFKM